ncbi:MAG: sigma-70 family RNA polymerase sigma factor [Rhizomicrobium sp.]
MKPDSPEARLGALMRSAQAGDQAAYAQLLHEVIPFIRRIVAPKCGYGVEPEDVVQDVLMALHAVRHTYDGTRPFTPWLAAIARHRLVDAYRRKARVARNETAVAELPETFAPAQPNWEGNAKGDPELLRRAIADLPPGQRQAVELLKLRELSLKEAEVVSGTSIAALKVAVHRGMKALRQRLVPTQTSAMRPDDE